MSKEPVRRKIADRTACHREMTARYAGVPSRSAVRLAAWIALGHLDAVPGTGPV